MSERIKKGLPPNRKHPVQMLARGCFHEESEPTKARVAALRQAGSRFGKKLHRKYEVHLETGDRNQPVVRVYRTR